MVLINEGLSIRSIAKRTGLSYTTIRYYFKKYKLKTKFKIKTCLCKDCGDTNPENFYQRRKERCFKCHNIRRHLAGKDRRAKAVQSMGGKCYHCPCTEVACLQFHHRDPSIKDPKFASMRGWSDERLEEELKKCDLLCANCHSIEHAKQREKPYYSKQRREKATS